MKKRLLALFISVIMGFSLAACNFNPSVNTDSDEVSVGTDSSSLGSTSQTDIDTETGTNSQTDSGSVTDSRVTDSQVTDSRVTDTSSSQSSSTSAEKEEPAVDLPVYDENLDHKVIFTDENLGGIVALDLDDLEQQWTKLDWKKNKNFSPIWEKNMENSSLCGVKYRYSPYYDTHVVLATGSNGKVYAYDYETKQRLWCVVDRIDNNVDISLYNAHSIEMLPNGDIIVATSGYAGGKADYENGGLHYYPAGSTTRSAFLSLPFAHAVLWDPSNECLWSIGYEGVVAVKITGEGTDATFSKIPEKSLKKSKFTGHDMVPVYGQDGKFLISDNGSVYLFDSDALTLTKSEYYSSSSVKGMAYFEDGTFIASTWAKQFKVYYNVTGNGGAPKATIAYLSHKVYKIHVMTDQYE